jgi:anti-anti-sigma factor
MAELDPAGPASAWLEAQDEDGILVLRIFGELDVTSADDVRSTLDTALGSEAERVVFDLGGLEFMDSSGIALLLSVTAKVREVQVRNPPAIIRRLLELTGLAETFRMSG